LTEVGNSHEGLVGDSGLRKVPIKHGNLTRARRQGSAAVSITLTLIRAIYSIRVCHVTYIQPSCGYETRDATRTQTQRCQ